MSVPLDKVARELVTAFEEIAVGDGPMDDEADELVLLMRLAVSQPAMPGRSATSGYWRICGPSSRRSPMTPQR
jgi:hypothetical protein